MGDKTEILLQKVLDENRCLRETMEARDAENKRLLEELTLNLNNSTSGKRSRTRKRNMCISKQCRQDFRKMYKALKISERFQGFALNESISTQANQDVTKSVIEAVMADHGGNDKCPWSPAEMKGAAVTYFKSLQDTDRRVSKRKQDHHKVVCRRQGRMRDKKERRLSTLQTMSWSEEKKAAISRALTMEYTSSDESDLSEDENGDQVRLKGYLVKKLSWERSTLTNIKQRLDQAYLKSLKPRLRAIVLERRRHPVPSSRGHPVDPVDWAVRTGEPDRSMQYMSSPPSTTGTFIPSPATTEQSVTPRASISQRSPDPRLPVNPRSLATTPTSRPAADLQAKHVKNSAAAKKKKTRPKS